ncbi:hypothetical protein MKW92_033834 [Papaver armeniacum]|nr:hypothetical protein MKW92_033834 [Papaver armeniacum]
MAVVENELGVVNNGSSANRTQTTQDSSNDLADQNNNSGIRMVDPNPNFHLKVQQFQQEQQTADAHISSNNNNQIHHQGDINNNMTNGNSGYGLQQQQQNNHQQKISEEGFKRDMRDLEELLSKLNPMAEEFVPPSLSNNGSVVGAGFYLNNFAMHSNNGNGNGNGNINRRKKNNYSQGRRRMNSRTSMAQREDIIRRTVYVSDIDHQVTEEQLAALFINCGQVVDCRICGDPHSVLLNGARAALSLAGTMLGYYPVRVLPSKTAIAPVNPTFLPRVRTKESVSISGDVRETIYCTNIDKKVSPGCETLFESICGETSRDYHHSTRAESAIAALNCSGVVLGSLPIRVSPSKTPVCPRSPRQMH